MTTKTPPRQKRQYSSQEVNKITKDTNTLKYGGVYANKAGINNSSLFDVQYIPTFRQRHVNQDKGYVEVTTVPPSDKIAIEKGFQQSDLQKDLKTLQYKVEAEDNNVEELDSDWKTVPVKVNNLEANMASNGYQVDELEWRNKVHSAKIHDIEKEIQMMKMENETMKGQIIGPKGGIYKNGSDERQEHGPENQFDRNVSRLDKPYGQVGDLGTVDYSQPDLKGQRRPIGEYEAHNIGNESVGARAEEPYWGFNRFYDPQFVTTYRREQVPYYIRKEERDQRTQYADDYNYLQEMQRRQEEEWRKRRQEEEEKLLKDKPKTYDYTAPYQALFPPRDINKYFHDSKYLDNKPEPHPDEYYFNEDVPYKQSPVTGPTTYGRVFIPPKSFELHQQQPGGLYVIRFHDSGFDEVNVSLKEQQTIIKSFNGYVLGVARKQNVISIEGDQEWRYSRVQNPRPQVSVRHRQVDDALAVLWFPSKDKAFDFFSNSFRNRFKQQGFPTPHSWEGHYIPMLTPPFLKTLDTYLIMELLNGAKYPPESLQQFEAEARQEVLKIMQNSLPFIVSAMKGRESFKPGPMFRDKSKIFISRFNSMSELSELWKTGVIQGLLQKWNLTGPLNVSAFSLKDWIDF